MEQTSRGRPAPPLSQCRFGDRKSRHRRLCLATADSAAEHDLYPFYPDLLIFHVYGANQQYEQIIKSARSRTTTEVLMQTDHVTKWPPAKVDPKVDKGMWWDDLMNHHILPEIAHKYGCGLCDNHTAWLEYLKDNSLEPKALLKDGVHLNAHGNDLMAHLVERYLVYRPDLPDTAWRDLTHTYEVAKGAGLESRQAHDPL